MKMEMKKVMKMEVKKKEKEIAHLEDQTRRMEDLLRKLIEDLYAEVVRRNNEK